MTDFRRYSQTQVERAIVTSRTSYNNLTIPEALDMIYEKDMKEKQQANAELNTLLNLNTRKMSKPDIIEATWRLPELDEGLYDLLTEQEGFMTGSSVISCIDNPKDEDWCVVISPAAFYGYTLGQTDQGYWEADGFTSLYCHYQGKLLNIICFSDVDLFNAWYFATVMLSKMKSSSLSTEDWARKNISINEIVNTKWKRVRLFRALKDVAYGPRYKKPMPKADALKYNKCCQCSREAINFTCMAAKKHYEDTAVCERCADIEY